MTMTETQPKQDEIYAADERNRERGYRRLRRWDPQAMLEEMQEEMTRLWGQAWPLMPRPVRRLPLAPSAWTPSLDVYEQDDTLIITAELPGVRKEDVEVTLDQGDLVIRGERRMEHEATEESYYRMERRYGSFYRRLPLPFEVKAEQITAGFHDGVLEIRIPRPAGDQAQPQKIALT